MKIALVGYGKMGRTIEQTALKRGHEIVSIIDIDNTEDFESEAFRSADVAIEFTVPSTAFDNYRKCFAAGIPVVSGTTGWLNRLEEIKRLCAGGENTFFYASNFSIGVNIFFAVNKFLAKVMNQFPQYDVAMTETHHIHKLDSPSGTAITLAGDIISRIDRKGNWVLGKAAKPTDIALNAFREGEVLGTHEIIYESETDSISIRHEAKSRQGFALGAVLAAEFTVGKKGFLSMDDLLKL
jgi:4-hydroxy-tetrahydrodipicolinate reductase